VVDAVRRAPSDQRRVEKYKSRQEEKTLFRLLVGQAMKT